MLQNRVLWVILLLALLAGVGWLLFVLRSVLTPFLCAFIMAYILNPIIVYGERKKLSRDFCIVFLMLTLLVVVVVVGVVVIPSMIDQGISLANRAPEMLKSLSGVLTRVENVVNRIDLVRRYYPLGLSLQPPDLATLISDKLGTGGAEVIGVAGEVSSSLFGRLLDVGVFLFYFGLFLVSTIYLLRDYAKVVPRFKEVIPPRHRELIFGILRDIDRNLKNFFRGQLTVCLINSTILSLFLSLAGVPYALLIGFLTGFLNIIPYLGVSIGFLLSLLIQFVTSETGGLAPLFYVVIAFGVQQAIDGTMITPRLLGDKVGLHPVIIIASFLIFGKLFGFFGVLLAVPLSTMVKVLFLHFLKLYKQSWVYGSDNEEVS